MKRVKTISASNDHTTVKITIAVTSKGGLMRDEVDKLTRGLTDDTIELIANAPFIGVHLSEVRVK